MTALQRFSARLIATSNINVSVTGVGVVIDGVAVADLDEVVLNGQTVQAENGLWVAHTGSAWTRHADFDASAEMLKGTEFYVREGSSDNAGSTWTFDTGGTITVGTTALKFKRESYGPGAAPTGEGLSRDPATNQWLLENISTPTGYFTQVQTDQYGRVLDALEAETGTTHVEGLEVTFVSANALDIAPGSAYVPGLNKVVELPLGASLTGLTLTANTFYYLYLYESGGTGAVELVTAVPDIPYLGAARTKGGGTPSENHRYIPNGAVRCSTVANTMLRFEKYGNFTKYQEDLVATRVLTNGTNTANTPIACGAFIPPTSRLGLFFLIGEWNATNRSYHFHTPGDGLSPSAGTGQYSLGVTGSNAVPRLTFPMFTDSSQQIEYGGGGSGANVSVTVSGYFEER